jgi:hypothetical protein
VSQNEEDTELYYGAANSFESILKGDVPVPPGAVPFVRAVAHYFVEAKTASSGNAKCSERQGVRSNGLPLVGFAS